MNKIQSITTGFILLSLLIPHLLPAQIHVPDPIFRQVIGYHGIKCDSMGFIINSEDAANIEQLKFSDLQQFNLRAITDLSGIEAFSGLKYLDCSGLIKVTKLDLSSNLRLKILACNFCPITSLDLKYNQVLEEFICENCNLSSLDVTYNKNLAVLLLNGNHQLQSLKLPDSKNINVQIRSTAIEKNKERTTELILYVCLGLLFGFGVFVKMKFLKDVSLIRLVFPKNVLDRVLNILILGDLIFLLYFIGGIDWEAGPNTMWNEALIFFLTVLIGLPILIVLLIIKLTIFLTRKFKKKDDSNL